MVDVLFLWKNVFLMIGEKILTFLLMRKIFFVWKLGSENKFTTTVKATAPPPLNPTGTDKKMVVALLKIMIHEYLFVVFF